MAEENTSNSAPDAASDAPKPEADTKAAAKPAAKPAAKKEKPPALEDKPFAEFIQQHYVPGLRKALEEQGVSNLELVFEERKIPVMGYAQAPACWQVVGHWVVDGRQPRDFSLYFFDGDIKGKKGFSFTEGGGKPSTLESFLIDERKVDLVLMLDRTLQRLNAQKWLVRN